MAAPGSLCLISTRIHLSSSRGGEGDALAVQMGGEQGHPAASPRPTEPGVSDFQPFWDSARAGSVLHGFPNPGIQTIFISLFLLCCLSGPLVKK